MLESKAALYRFTLIISVVVYGWVGYNLFSIQSEGVPAPQVCLLKRATDIPCPFCGTTRSIMFASQGHFVKAFFSNPFGLIIAIVTTICPLWILIDFMFKRNSFYPAFIKVKSLLQPKWWLFVIVILIVTIWVWNIKRGI